ncbi:MAG: MgtC/SapB family protein [Anaerorhabdus sp.]
MLEILINISNSFSLEVLLRLTMALACGVYIGRNRSKKGSPAGIKTHSLVAIGSALVVLYSEFLFNNYGGVDLARVPAQVISGIGFLGAGTILVTGDKQIQGLTSAASIWFTACVGLAVGSGFYLGAFYAVTLELFVLKILKNYSEETAPNILELYIQYNKDLNFVDIIKILKDNKCEIIYVNNRKFQGYQFDGDNTKISIVSIKTSYRSELKKAKESLIQIKGIEEVGEI